MYSFSISVWFDKPFLIQAKLCLKSVPISAQWLVNVGFFLCVWLACLNWLLDWGPGPNWSQELWQCSHPNTECYAAAAHHLKNLKRCRFNINVYVFSMYLSFIPFTEFASRVTEIAYVIQYQFTVTSNLQITAYCKMTCLLLCIIWKNVCCLIYRCTSVIFSEIQWWFHWWHIELVMYFIRLLFLITLLSIHHAAWIIFGWVSGQKEKKEKNLHCLTFQDASCRGLSPCCSVWQVQPDEIPVSRVTLFPANPRIPLNCMNTKPLWICHLPSFYLGLQAVFPHKAARWLQAALSQVFLSAAFLQKLKEWSQCYQKITQYRT